MCGFACVRAGGDQTPWSCELSGMPSPTSVRAASSVVPSLQPLVLVVLKNKLGFAEIFEDDSTHISPYLFISSSLELPKAINGKYLYFHMTPEAN